MCWGCLGVWDPLTALIGLWQHAVGLLVAAILGQCGRRPISALCRKGIFKGQWDYRICSGFVSVLLGERDMPAEVCGWFV